MYNKTRGLLYLSLMNRARDNRWEYCNLLFTPQNSHNSKALNIGHIRPILDVCTYLNAFSMTMVLNIIMKFSNHCDIFDNFCKNSHRLRLRYITTAAFCCIKVRWRNTFHEAGVRLCHSRELS